ncbi:hypothetical protein ACFL4W_05170 [Planctomycetota bacterium]
MSIDKTNRFISILKSKIFRWSILVFCVMLSITFTITSIINHSYKKDIIKESEELAVEIEQFVAQRYGDLSTKKNAWAFFDGLSEMEDAFSGVIEDEEYHTLPLQAQRKRLMDLGVFKFCEDLAGLDDYDVIMPECFYPFDMAAFDQSLLGEKQLSLIKVKSTVLFLRACADWHFRNSEKEKGLALQERGFQFIRMLPTGSLLHNIIKIACAEVLLGNVLEHFKEYSEDDLKILENEIALTSLINPLDYYSFWLFEAYTVYAFTVNEDVLRAIEEYNDDSSILSWFWGNLICELRLVAEAITNYRKCHEIFRRNIPVGNYVKAGEELQTLVDELRKDSFYHGIARIGAHSLALSMICSYENDTRTLLALLSIKARLYWHQHQVYPVSFNDFVKDREYGHLRIAEDGRTIEFRGQKVGFIEKMSDGNEYSGDESRKTHFALCATPLVYGTTGETSFITNETGIIYSSDRGESISVTEWPADPEAACWVILE